MLGMEFSATAAKVLALGEFIPRSPRVDTRYFWRGRSYSVILVCTRVLLCHSNPISYYKTFLSSAGPVSPFASTHH